MEEVKMGKGKTTEEGGQDSGKKSKKKAMGKNGKEQKLEWTSSRKKTKRKIGRIYRGRVGDRGDTRQWAINIFELYISFEFPSLISNYP